MTARAKRFFYRIFKGLVTLFAVGLLMFVALLIYAEWQLPDVSVLKNVDMQVPLRVYSSDGKLMAQYGAKRRIPVQIDQIPKPLIQAVLATEDARFYSHPGVDIIGLARAVVAVVATGRKVQGASTITMQVARNFFLTRKKTYTRKFKEILLAIKIDRELSKEKILELYLNKVYFGNRAYGVAAAARVYYGKKLNELTLPEMAMIAGLPQAPSRNNPLRKPKQALKRRNHVLWRMLDVGFINNKTYEAAVKAPITASYHEQKITFHAPYIAEMVRQALLKVYGDSAYDIGLKVYTTIDSTLQNATQVTLKSQLSEYNKQYHIGANEPGVQGAVVVLNPQTGALMALDGGYDFEKSHFNRATQAQRQTGSNFKPFIYSAALDSGMTLATIINDAPIVLEDTGENNWWRPQNDNLKFYGPTRLRVGLTKSRNLVSIRLLRDVGVSRARNYLMRFGFSKDQLPDGLSLALGSGVLTPLQVARGYAVFANGGHLMEPYFIGKILDQQDKVIYKAFVPDALPQVITKQNAYLMTQALRDVIRTGTGRAARALQRADLAGKTGTTNNKVDAWFSGFNNNVVTTVWVGFDNATRSLHRYGSQVALPIWIQVMKAALANQPIATMPEPSDIVTARIDPRNGLLAAPGQSGAMFEVFRKQYAPKAFSHRASHVVAKHSLDSEDGHIF